MRAARSAETFRCPSRLQQCRIKRFRRYIHHYLFVALSLACTSTDIFRATVAVTKTGTTRLTPVPVWYSTDKVKSAVEITNEETKALLTKSLKPQKKKAEKKKDGEEKKE